MGTHQNREGISVRLRCAHERAVVLHGGQLTPKDVGGREKREGSLGGKLE